MTVKTFFIKKREIYPREITEKLKENFSAIRDNRCLKGDLYETKNGEVIRYYWNLIEILTFGPYNYQIKSELEKLLNLKLVEPN